MLSNLILLLSVFFISVIVAFISDYLFSVVSISLLTFSLSLFISSLSSLSIFMISVFNSVSGKLLVSFKFTCVSLLLLFAVVVFSYGALCFSFIWDVFPCLLILADFLCLFLCIKYIWCILYSWQSGLCYRCPLKPSGTVFLVTLPRFPGLSLVSVLCALLLWLRFDYWWHISV